jgi:hypothetical protein
MNRYSKRPLKSHTLKAREKQRERHQHSQGFGVYCNQHRMRFVKGKPVPTCPGWCPVKRENEWWRKYYHLIEGHKGGVIYKESNDTLYMGFVSNTSTVVKTMPQAYFMQSLSNIRLGGFAVSTSPFQGSKEVPWQIAFNELRRTYVYGLKRGQKLYKPTTLAAKRNSPWTGIQNCDECKAKRDKFVTFLQKSYEIDNILEIGDKMLAEGQSYTESSGYVRRAINALRDQKEDDEEREQNPIYSGLR